MTSDRITDASDASLTVVHGPAGSGKDRWVEAHFGGHETIWISVDQTTTAVDIHMAVLDGLTVHGASIPAELRTVRFGHDSVVTGLARADQLGTTVGELFDAAKQRARVLVLSRLDRLADNGEAFRFIESLTRTAVASIQVVLVSENGHPFAIDRMLATGEAREVGFDALGLTHEAAQLRAAELCRLPDCSPEQAEDVHNQIVELAEGRGALLDVLAVLMRRLDDDGERRSALRLIGGSRDRLRYSFTRLVGELSQTERDLVGVLALLGNASIDELERFGLRDAQLICERLETETVLRRDPRSNHRFALSRLIDRSLVLQGIAPATVEQVATVVHNRGDIRQQLAIAMEAGTHSLLAQTLENCGAALVDSGHSQSVLEAIDALRARQQATEFAWLEGRAAQALGITERALAAFEIANHANPAPAEVWRHGLLLYVHGDVAAARSVLQRLDLPDVGASESPCADLAMVAALRGSTAWLMSDLASARAHREKAFSLAPATGASWALAAAHTLAALCAASNGDRVANDWHYVKALGYAESSGDLWQIGRIRINRGSRLLEEGEYPAALVELDEAVRSADLGGYATVLAMALTNRAEVEVRVGRLDEARVDAQNAIEILQEQGSARVAYPLGVLARLFVVRGDNEQAISACERALAQAERVGDRQALVAVRVQLARAIAGRDTERAMGYLDQAVAEDAQSLDLAEAWVTVADLASTSGDVERAIEAVRLGAEVARERRDRFSLAHAIEVSAQFEQTEPSQLERLDEAAALFRELGCHLDEVRIAAKAAMLDPSASRLARVRAGAASVQRAGARPLMRLVDQVLSDSGRSRATLQVKVLGSFSLLRRGEEVPVTAWQSRKARDLFKMLVVRRGRPLSRELIVERLWPDDQDYTKAGQKLSVALATVRSVLDPDKDFDAEHFVQADAESVRLNTSDIRIDVDNFLSLAANALAESRGAHADAAVAMLEAAEATYNGDVLEDDPYVDWHTALREEARLVYFDVARLLADHRANTGELTDAVRLLLRILESEPYDESTHLNLVRYLSRSGRHGDARRAHGRYVERMREIGIEPAGIPVDVSP